MSTPIQQNTAALEELLEAAANLPEGGGGGGATTWEDLGVVGYEEGILIPYGEAVFAEDMGMFIRPENLVLAAGSKYTVSWRSDATIENNFECIAEAFEVEGMPIIGLGNTSILGGTMTTEHPFAILCNLPVQMTSMGVGCMIVPLDGATTYVRIEISGQVPVIRAIPFEFLPNNQCVIKFTPTETTSEIPMLIPDITSKEAQAIIRNGKRAVVAHVVDEGGTTTVYNLDSFNDETIYFTSISVLTGEYKVTSKIISWNIDTNRASHLYEELRITQ